MLASAQAVPEPDLEPESGNQDEDPKDSQLGGHSISNPKPRSIACRVCRKRKLRCDGCTPCSTCSRLGHDCAYDEGRKKSGPRRGHTKGLETRLAQVEELLKKYQDAESAAIAGSAASDTAAEPKGAIAAEESNEFSNEWIPYLENEPFDMDYQDTGFPMAGLPGVMDYDSQAQIHFRESPELSAEVLTSSQDDSFSWAILELGLNEPLPVPEVVEELNEIYFDKIQPSVPILHKYRFLASMDLSPQSRPPIYLRYAMWALAALVSERYSDLKEHFYNRARRYVEMEETFGHGEKVTTLAHIQCCVLIGIYDFKMMHFPRGWLNTGRAVRLAQMMGMHRLDGLGLEVRTIVQPPRTWIEREERRRTFWMAFCMDRYATTGTGWPMAIDERDILTNLPCSEEAFEQGIETHEMSLSEAMDAMSARRLSPFAGVIVVASLFGRTLVHLHRPNPGDNDDDLNGEFWKRHRQMDEILLNVSLCLPNHLRVSALSSSSNTIFLNMSLHAATICLHQVAMFKAQKNQLPSHITDEMKMRCMTSAAEIASLMKMVAHTDLARMNTFVPFCLFVSTRIFTQYVRKTGPNDESAKSTIRFLMSAMTVLKQTNPLAESFLAQLDVELEGTGIEPPRNTSQPAPSGLDSGLSNMSIADDTTWVKIVSPLVVIAEQSEESMYAPPAAPETVLYPMGEGGVGMGGSVGTGTDFGQDTVTYMGTESSHATIASGGAGGAGEWDISGL